LRHDAEKGRFFELRAKSLIGSAAHRSVFATVAGPMQSCIGNIRLNRGEFYDQTAFWLKRAINGMTFTYRRTSPEKAREKDALRFSFESSKTLPAGW
jgi:hypothetical protein